MPRNGSTISPGCFVSVTLSSRHCASRFRVWIIRIPYSMASRLSSDWMKYNPGRRYCVTGPCLTPSPEKNTAAAAASAAAFSSASAWASAKLWNSITSTPSGFASRIAAAARCASSALPTGSGATSIRIPSFRSIPASASV